jgi:hypothetical protein
VSSSVCLIYEHGLCSQTYSDINRTFAVAQSIAISSYDFDYYCSNGLCSQTSHMHTISMQEPTNQAANQLSNHTTIQQTKKQTKQMTYSNEIKNTTNNQHKQQHTHTRKHTQPAQAIIQPHRSQTKR